MGHKYFNMGPLGVVCNPAPCPCQNGMFHHKYVGHFVVYHEPLTHNEKNDSIPSSKFESSLIMPFAYKMAQMMKNISHQSFMIYFLLLFLV